MHFDRFDICEAYYVYAMLWGHDDFTRSVDVRLDRMRFRPGVGLDDVGDLTDNAREIYGALVRCRQARAVALGRMLRRFTRSSYRMERWTGSPLYRALLGPHRLVPTAVQRAARSYVA